MVDRRVLRELSFIATSLSRTDSEPLQELGERHSHGLKIVQDSPWNELSIEERKELLSDPEVYENIERIQRGLAGGDITTRYFKKYQPTSGLPVGMLDDTFPYHSNSRALRYISD